MKSNDFDKLAFIYDRLAQFVFGKSIIESQQFFLNKIPDGSQVLILGGGSGWLVEKLFAVKPTIEICYIEASEKMIRQAKTRLPHDQRIQFIHGTENDIPNHAFNAVITNFYLDLFEETKLKAVVQKVKMLLAPQAKWLVTDFVSEHGWQRLMLKIMYFFFKATTKIEASKLPNWSAALQQIGGTKTDSKLFYGDFIETSVFQF